MLEGNKEIYIHRRDAEAQSKTLIVYCATGAINKLKLCASASLR